MELRKKFEKVCGLYVEAFCKLMGFNDYDCYWLGGEVGRTLSVTFYVFDFSDIRYIVDNNVPKDVVMGWYEYDAAIGEYNDLPDVAKIAVPRLRAWNEGAEITPTLEEIKAKIEQYYVTRN